MQRGLEPLGTYRPTANYIVSCFIVGKYPPRGAIQSAGLTWLNHILFTSVKPRPRSIDQTMWGSNPA